MERSQSLATTGIIPASTLTLLGSAPQGRVLLGPEMYAEDDARRRVEAGWWMDPRVVV